MDLVAVSRRFDMTPLWDAYTGEKLSATCQVTVWDNPRRDGLTTLRRTLSMAYSVELPARHTLIIGGQVWIVSAYSNPDTWEKDVSRKGYVAQLAELGRISRTSQLLDGSGEYVYMSRVWVKDVKDITTSSEFQSQYYIYFTKGENFEEGEFAFIKDRWHIIRNVYTSTAGFYIAECNELEPECIFSLSVDVGDYDPVSETTTKDIRQIPVIKLDWRDDYTNSLPSAEPQQVGDIRFRTSQEYAEYLEKAVEVYFEGAKWKLVRVEHRNHGAISVVVRKV